jgi:hypothetical protein
MISDTLTSDLVAAVIVTIMLIPQSLAYALLAGLPPEMGIYASIAPIILYAIFGTSRALAVGPVAVVSLMTAAAVGRIAEVGSTDYITRQRSRWPSCPACSCWPCSVCCGWAFSPTSCRTRSLPGSSLRRASSLPPASSSMCSASSASGHNLYELVWCRWLSISVAPTSLHVGHRRRVSGLPVLGAQGSQSRCSSALGMNATAGGHHQPRRGRSLRLQ